MKNIIDTVKSILSEPKKFFHSAAKFKSFKGALILFLIFYAVIMGISFLQSAVNILIRSPVSVGGASGAVVFIASIVGLFFGLAIAVIFSIAFMFLGVLVIHGFFKLFNGKGKYKDSFNLLVYSAVPGYVLGLIVGVFSFFVSLFVSDPVISLALMIPLAPLYIGVLAWQIYLMITGGSILHRVSKLNAFFAGILLPFLVSLLLFALIVVVFGLGEIISLSQISGALGYL